MSKFLDTSSGKINIDNIIRATTHRDDKKVWSTRLELTNGKETWEETVRGDKSEDLLSEMVVNNRPLYVLSMCVTADGTLHRNVAPIIFWRVSPYCTRTEIVGGDTDIAESIWTGNLTSLTYDVCKETPSDSCVYCCALWDNELKLLSIAGGSDEAITRLYSNVKEAIEQFSDEMYSGLKKRVRATP